MIDDRQAHSVLARLLAVPAPDRAAWLDRVLPGEGDLHDRMLAAVTAQSDGLAIAPESSANLSMGATPYPDPLLGQRLGPFVVQERVPEQGGMGTVYRGRRADGTFVQDVAIKVIPRGRDTDVLLRRFSLERRVLGRLQHAHIVRILDAGATADGRPYLVMEWVDGLPLDRFCADQRLNLTERLQLFQQVCAAVQYAHQHFIVHRDLKPGNVLVTRAGTPKVLDFGLAKVLDEESGAAGFISRAEERPMTPAYASPEQVRRGAITTATDVYALGLILFELLTGERPYRLKSSSATEIERVICEQDPAVPSHVARTRTLRGELDAIVLRALQKQPAARYQSPAALSDDIARYLDGRPVLARSVTAPYRCAKFVRRHFKGLTAAAIAVAVMAAFVAQNMRHASKLTVERDRAEASLKFLVSLFKASDPDNAKGDTITAGELLDRGVDRLTTELQNQPQTRASLLFTIGSVFDSLGRFDAADAALQQSVELKRTLRGNPGPELAEVLNALGRVARAKGEIDRAERLYVEALLIRRATLDADDPSVAQSLSSLGQLLRDRGDLTTAEAHYRQALNILRRRNDPDRAAVLLGLANVLNKQSKPAAALHASREAWETSAQIYGSEHTTTLAARYFMVWDLLDLGEYSEAERAAREVAANRSRILGDAHPRVAEAWYSLGFTLTMMGRIDEAERALRASEAVWRRLPGKVENRAAWTLRTLAGVLSKQGRYAEAEAMHREALDMRVRRLGKNDPDVGDSWLGLGDMFHRQGRWPEAEQYFRMDVELQRAQPKAAPKFLVMAEEGLGRLLTESGRLDEAEPLLRHALQSRRRDLPAESPGVAFVEVLLGDCIAKHGQFEEAEPLLRRGTQLLRMKEREGERTRYAETRLAALVESRDKGRY